MGKHEDNLDRFLDKNCKCQNCKNYLFGKCKIDPINRTFSPSSLCAGFIHANPKLKEKEEQLKEKWYQEHLEEIGETEQ